MQRMGWPTGRRLPDAEKGGQVTRYGHRVRFIDSRRSDIEGCNDSASRYDRNAWKGMG